MNELSTEELVRIQLRNFRADAITADEGTRQILERVQQAAQEQMERDIVAIEKARSEMMINCAGNMAAKNALVRMEALAIQHLREAWEEKHG